MEKFARLKSRVVLTICLAFFFGFPAAGLFWFRSDMHHKIEKEAKAEAEVILSDVFSQGVDALVKRTVQSQLETLDRDEQGRRLSQVGKLTGAPTLKAERSWVENRQDQMWQATHLKGEVRGEKGVAAVDMTIIRPYIRPNWMVRSLTISPRSS